MVEAYLGAQENLEPYVHVDQASWWHNRDGGVPMALIYSDVKSHFNMPDLTLDNLMEILFVTGRKKDRWEFAYVVDVQQVLNGVDFCLPQLHASCPRPSEY